MLALSCRAKQARLSRFRYFRRDRYPFSDKRRHRAGSVGAGHLLQGELNMPLFSMETLIAPISMPDAWEGIVAAGNLRPKDNRLLPEECDESEKIIWLERLRLFAVEHGGDLSILEPYKDFQGNALSRRPDPTWDQWIWLYQQIGARRGNRSMRDVIPIMACRDALLPFLETIPDKNLWDEYTSMLTLEQYEGPDNPFPYPNLEAAFQADAPEQMELLQMLCRDVSNEVILNRAVAEEKTAIVEFKLKTVPLEQKIQILTAAHASWEDPAPLFRRFLPMFKDEIAAWRDAWGNGFFWYLYRRPVLSQTLIERLPKKVLETFATCLAPVSRTAL